MKISYQSEDEQRKISRFKNWENVSKKILIIREVFTVVSSGLDCEVVQRGSYSTG